MERPKKCTGSRWSARLVKHRSTYVRCHPCCRSFVKGPPSSPNVNPLISKVEINSPPVSYQDYNSPVSSDSDATSPDSDENQDNSSSQPNKHVVADDTQESNQVVTDPIFPDNSPENQDNEGVDTATGSSDTHNPIEENIQQDYSNTSAQSVASAESSTRNMDIR